LYVRIPDCNAYDRSHVYPGWKGVFKNMKKISTLLLVCMLLGGCGGSGGDDENTLVAPTNSIYGIYDLTEIRFIFKDGATDSVSIPNGSPEGSGRLTINRNNYVTIEMWSKTTGPVTEDGWYENGYIGNSSGKIPVSLKGRQALLTFGPEYLGSTDFKSVTMVFDKVSEPYTSLIEESVEIVEDASENGEIAGWAGLTLAAECIYRCP